MRETTQPSPRKVNTCVESCVRWAGVDARGASPHAEPQLPPFCLIFPLAKESTAGRSSRLAASAGSTALARRAGAEHYARPGSRTWSLAPRRNVDYRAPARYPGRRFDARSAPPDSSSAKATTSGLRRNSRLPAALNSRRPLGRSSNRTRRSTTSGVSCTSGVTSAVEVLRAHSQASGRKRVAAPSRARRRSGHGSAELALGAGGTAKGGDRLTRPILCF